jgi:glycosyltransferase involved in cell wall biosynthesis
VNARPLVSIITPSYQQAAYLGNNLLSIQGQSYRAIEHIVIDGGSNDGTVELLTRTPGDRLWVSEPDGGQANALNKGIRMSHGEIIGWVNSDDFLYPQAVERAVEVLEAHDSDLVYGKCCLVDREANIVGMYHTEAFDYRRLVAANIIAQPALFMRRRLFDNAGPFDEDLTCSMDYEYWLRCGRMARFEYVDEVFAAYRLHSNAKTSTQARMLAKEANALRRRYGRRELNQFALNAAIFKAWAGGIVKSTSIGFWLLRQFVWSRS